MTKTKIGKYVIDSLTRSMYEDSRCIYREYIQNAADQIDMAREQKLEENDYYEIHVRIFHSQRRIEIEDTATGLSRDNRDALKDVATSQKTRGERKGFRGIGRLGGLGYCTTLTFETSFKGENVKTIMRWDAAKMNKIVDDEEDTSEAGDVIDECTSFEEMPERAEKHYFKVILDNVTDDRLLDINDIRDYLSMVAPVDYPTQFNIFASKIKEYVQMHNIKLDVYDLYLGDENGEEQIYKGYTTKIIDAHNGDYDIKDIKLFEKCDDNGNLIYWGWYSISESRGQIPANNVAYGIRLRCKNIQIGDERTCRNFFLKETDKRFSQYFYGELHVETPQLMPDARRDYLRECDYRSTFEKMVIKDFDALKSLCNDASTIRSLERKIRNAEREMREIQDKKASGLFLSPQEIEENREDYNRFKKQRDKSVQKYEKKRQELEENGSPLNSALDKTPSHEFDDHNPLSLNRNLFTQETMNSPDDKCSENEPDESLPKLRTDNAIYSRFDSKEKKIINIVYNAIYNSIAEKNLREKLILKIEKELTK